MVLIISIAYHSPIIIKFEEFMDINTMLNIKKLSLALTV